MVVHARIINTFKVSAESKMFHSLKKIWVVRQYVFEWTMPVTRLPHQNSTTLFQNFGFNNSGFISEVGHILTTSKDCLDRLMIAMGAQ